MKILYIITGLGMGGAETQVCNLADKFEQLGHQVTIVYLFGEQVVSPVRKNVGVIGLGLKQNPISLVKTLFKLVSLIKYIRPDVVHSHMVHANLISRITRLFCKIPVLISSAHNSNEGGKLRMLAYKFTHKLSDLTTNVGQMSVQSFYDKGAAPNGELVSMVNGINVTKFSPTALSTVRTELNLNTSDRLILAVGRNEEQKDYLNLLKAIAALGNRTGFHLAIVGHNTENLKSGITQLELQDKVTVLGLRRDVDKLMGNTDALIMSSAWEGLPIVIGEAMASGCNIITTDAGGCREWLTDNESVVPTQDSQALAFAIENKLAQSDDEWERISKLNRQHIIDNFSIDGVAAKWLKYYQDPKSAFYD